MMLKETGDDIENWLPSVYTNDIFLVIHHQQIQTTTIVI